MGNPLLDKDFLRELDLNRNKVIYARLTSLDFDENPISYIEGRVTGGSINVDGTSVVRRTCNLTLISEDVNINEFYWGLNTKIILEIGVQNTINKKYPEVIWFKQGIFVITTFNTSIGTNQSTITVNGKDKGCLLNGDIAGNLPASIDFGTSDEYVDSYEPVELDETTYKAYTYYIEQQKTKIVEDPDTHETHEEPIPNKYEFVLDTGKIDETHFGFADRQYYKKYTNLQRTQLKLYDIIREAVHKYAKEPYKNIVINDLENYGLELVQYYGDKDIYMLRAVDTGDFEHIILNGQKNYYTQNEDSNAVAGQLEQFKRNEPGAIPDNRVDELNAGATPIYFYPSKTIQKDPETGEYVSVTTFTKPYTVAVISAGETAGYRMTDLVYNGDLIANIGETLSSILDKIKNMLGDFEYFYDIDGRFIFQRKKTYVNTSWNSIVTSNDERFTQSLVETSAVTYSFEGNVLLTAIQQSPVLNNLKNDYAIWGKRKGITGQEIPVHLRYAIHKKPKYYRAIDGEVYTTDKEYAKSILAHTDVQTITHMVSKFANFELEHLDEYPPALTPPTKKANGLWTPGWWDIRDWARYYKLIMDTEEDPAYTMKWYSYNGIEGCVPISSINDPDIPQYYRSSGYYAWLIVITRNTNPNGKQKYSYNFQHGSGNPSGRPWPCNKWYSYYDDETGELKTEMVSPKETVNFIPPFSGCSDYHTYLHFLNEDFIEGKRNVYFYNPQFPDIDDLDSFIEQQMTVVQEEWVNDDIIHEVDWREIIYQMAVDYYRYNTKPTDEYTINLYNDNGWDINNCGDNFLPTLVAQNKLGNGDYLYPDGYTGYEQYYEDFQGFWRQLYCPSYDKRKWNIQYTMYNGEHKAVAHKKEGNEGFYEINESEYVPPTVDSFSCDFYLPVSAQEEIDEEIAYRGYGNQTGYSDTRYRKDANDNYVETNVTVKGWHTDSSAADCYYKSYFNNDYQFWSRTFIDDPAMLNFWIDFLDTGELGQFDVTAVGARQKVVNDNDVKAIYNKEVPAIIFVDSNTNFKTIDRKTGYTYCKLNSALDNLFTISSMGKSAKEVLDTLLYQHAYCVENVTLSTIPIYYLQPNTRIFVHDDKTKIDGDYIVTKFTIPLTTTGTMSITANKAPQRIY